MTFSVPSPSRRPLLTFTDLFILREGKPGGFPKPEGFPFLPGAFLTMSHSLSDPFGNFLVDLLPPFFLSRNQFGKITVM